MFRKKKNIPEPNILTQRFAAGPPQPKRREGSKLNGKIVAIFTTAIIILSLAAIQFIPINKEEFKHWSAVLKALEDLEKNPLNKESIAMTGKAANAIDDIESNQEIRAGILTVFALGRIITEMPGASYSNCEVIIQRYPQTPFAEMITREKLFKEPSSHNDKCPVCNGTGKRPEKQSLSSGNSGVKKLGSVSQKCLTCGGTGRKKVTEQSQLDKEKVRAQYDEARSKTVKLASAKMALTKSSALISKLQFFRNRD